MCPAQPSVRAKSQVSFYASWGNFILKMQHCTTRQAKTENFRQLNWVCPSGNLRFCKTDSDANLESLTVTRVPSTHSVKNVTRVVLSYLISQRDSSRVRVTKIVTRVESLTRVTLSLILCALLQMFQNQTQYTISTVVRNSTQANLQNNYSNLQFRNRTDSAK